MIVLVIVIVFFNLFLIRRQGGGRGGGAMDFREQTSEPDIYIFGSGVLFRGGRAGGVPSENRTQQQHIYIFVLLVCLGGGVGRPCGEPTRILSAIQLHHHRTSTITIQRRDTGGGGPTSVHSILAGQPP